MADSNMSLTGKAPMNSDESNSTEHDATISLSGTDEFNDTHSVFSDSASVASRSSKHMDAKKTLFKMNKLKEENMLLKESLEKANATDITMLKAKLRGSNADLVRLRQNNSELKDRIQVLEGRLFSALSAQTTSSRKVNEVAVKSVTFADDDSGSAATPIITMEPVTAKVDKLGEHDRAHHMDMIKSLQSRCKHLAKLVQSYETKIGILQEEKSSKQIDTTSTTAPTVQLNVDHQGDSSAASVSTDAPHVPLKSALKQSEQAAKMALKAGSAKPVRSVKLLQSETESIIAEARADDLKMIKELSAEVKRLVALVPRNKIEQSEYNESSADNGEKTKTNVDENDERPRSRSSSHASVTNTNSDSMRNNAQKRVTSVRSRDNKNEHVLYSSSELLFSFIAGVLIMLLCVAITGYSGVTLGAGNASPVKD